MILLRKYAIETYRRIPKPDALGFFSTPLTTHASLDEDYPEAPELTIP
jgi:hypothetical protein